MKTNLFFYIAILCLLSSCIPQKNIEYFSDSELLGKKYTNTNNYEAKIKPGDNLLIKVTSFDNTAFNYFEAQGSDLLQSSNELSLSSVSYSVSNSGNIFFPVIGNLYVKGSTLTEASISLKEKLATYFDQPNVIISFAFKKITILGEVNNPGNHTYTKDQINIFEALGIAEDITVHGNRKEVLIIRSENNITQNIIIDLTSDNILQSENYYLKADDIVYVKPRRSVKWDVLHPVFSSLLSSITAAILVLTYVRL